MSSNNVIGNLPKALNTGEFEWTFKLSDEILEDKRRLDSPTFSFSHASWFVRMYPKGYEAAEYISLYLWIKDVTQSEMNVVYSLGMLLNGMQLKKKKATTTFGKDKKNSGWVKFLPRRKVLEQWSQKTEECSQLTIKIRMMSDNVPPKEGLNPYVTPNTNYLPAYELKKKPARLSSRELAAIMMIGTRVVSEDEPGEGSVVHRRGGYLKLAVPLPVQQLDSLPVQQLDSLPVQHLDSLPVQQLDSLPVQQLDSLPDSVDENGEDNGTPKLNFVYKMCHDLKQLLSSEEGSDVTLQVQDQQFKAHRSVLASRSSVFAAMFRHDMKEKASGVVNVKDCEPSSFKVLLEFMYCCTTEKLSVENVYALYTSADKYNLEDLKMECLEFIKKNLSIETFCETVRLAFQHPESNLLDMGVEFFAGNMKEIIVTGKWQALNVENPIQCNEILIKASAQWHI